MKAKAKRLGRMEAASYPVEMQVGGEELAASDTHIVVRGGKDAAYLAWEREDREVYIVDLAVLPRWRTNPSVWRELTGVLQAMDADVISAHCRDTSASIAVRVLARMGFRVSTRKIPRYWGTAEEATEVVAKR